MTQNLGAGRRPSRYELEEQTEEATGGKKDVVCRLSIEKGAYRLAVGEKCYQTTDFYECLINLIDYAACNKCVPVSLSINAELTYPQKRVLEGIVHLHNQKCYIKELDNALIHELTSG